MYRSLSSESDGSTSQYFRTRRTRLVHSLSTKTHELQEIELKIPWRSLHVIISLVTIVSGFCTFLPLGYVQKYFLQQCLLYADVRFNYIAKNSTALIYYSTSTWGEQFKCTYTTFSSVAASIHAFIWGWFFLMMRSAFNRKNHEFSLLIPSVIFHGVLFVVVFISSCYINEGIDIWCKNFYREINTFNTGRRMTCKDAQTLNWDVHHHKHSFYTFLSTARVATWFLTLSVLLQCIVCIYKMYTGIMEEIAEMNRTGSEKVNSGYTDSQSEIMKCDKQTPQQNGKRVKWSLSNTPSEL